MIKRFLMIVVTLMVVGCGTKQCITFDGPLVGGEPTKIGYCIDLPKSQVATSQLGQPTMILDVANIGPAWMIREADVKKLIDKLGVNSLNNQGDIPLGLRLKDALK